MQVTSPFGLYIHIPFCEKKCAYCDFNTYAGLQGRFQATVDALCSEMERWQISLRDRIVSSVFVGGGTPTVLSGAQLGQLFAAIERNFDLAPHCELTCEANPGTVDRAKFAVLRDLGVNRLSLGVQSFQPAELRFLSRIHSVEDVLLAYDVAQSAGFSNINLDFIFGLPQQPLASWQATLEQALALRPQHLSLYSLIVEPNTPLHQWVARGEVPAPDEDLAADHYEFALQRLAAAGYRHYEVSNWALCGAADTSGSIAPAATPQYASQHNLLYWRNQEYLGIGPGAHSHIVRRDAEGCERRYRWGNRKSVPGYIKRVQSGDEITEFCEQLDPATAMGETMMLGLRLVGEGISFAGFEAAHGQDLRTVFAQDLQQLCALGLIDIGAERVRLTQQGLLFGNQVFARFLPDADSTR